MHRRVCAHLPAHCGLVVLCSTSWLSEINFFYINITISTRPLRLWRVASFGYRNLTHSMDRALITLRAIIGAVQ